MGPRCSTMPVFAADHQAEAPFRPHTPPLVPQSTRWMPAADRSSARRDVVPVVGVAAVDDHVAWLHQGAERLDRLAGDLPAGTITHAARGTESLPTKSASELAPVAPPSPSPADRGGVRRRRPRSCGRPASGGGPVRRPSARDRPCRAASACLLPSWLSPLLRGPATPGVISRVTAKTLIHHPPAGRRSGSGWRAGIVRSGSGGRHGPHRRQADFQTSGNRARSLDLRAQRFASLTHEPGPPGARRIFKDGVR